MGTERGVGRWEGGGAVDDRLCFGSIKTLVLLFLASGLYLKRKDKD